MYANNNDINPFVGTLFSINVFFVIRTRKTGMLKIKNNNYMIIKSLSCLNNITIIAKGILMFYK